MKRLCLAYRVAFHAMMFVMLLQSVGWLCDDCMLATSSESCQHFANDHEEHSQGVASFADPCVNSLCSLCGAALQSRRIRITPPHALITRCQANALSYHYISGSGLFRPPRG